MTKKTNKNQTAVASAIAAPAIMQTNRDLTFSILIVSVAINMFFLTAWVTLQVTSIYDSQVASFLFNR